MCFGFSRIFDYFNPTVVLTKLNWCASFVFRLSDLSNKLKFSNRHLGNEYMHIPKSLHISMHTAHAYRKGHFYCTAKAWMSYISHTSAHQTHCNATGSGSHVGTPTATLTQARTLRRQSSTAIGFQVTCSDYVSSHIILLFNRK